MKQSDRRNQSTRKLIKAYLELAAEQGVASITFDSIGQRAGYSRGLASQKFGSKHGLLEAVLNQLHEDTAALLSEAHVGELSGLDGLLMYCKIHLSSQKLNSELKAYFILYCSAVADQSEMRDAFISSNKRTRDSLINIIERGKEDGTIRPDTNSKYAAVLIGNTLGSLSINAISDPKFDTDLMYPELQKMVVRSYAAHPDQSRS
jgi:AcrR family transcriptional regulator